MQKHQCNQTQCRAFFACRVTDWCRRNSSCSCTKGDMEVLLAIYQVSEEYGFSILVNSIPYLLHQPSAILITHWTFQQQQNRGKLHKHDRHIPTPESNEGWQKCPERGVLRYMGYIGMCSPKGCGFSAVLVINRESILADFGHFWS